MSSQTHTQFIESINRLTKQVIENTDSFNNYYLEQDNSFYSETLPYLMKSYTDRDSNINKEKRLIQLKKNNLSLNILRHEHFRSIKIPKLCPIYNNKGELIPSIAINSKISKKDFNNTISSTNSFRSLGSFPFKIKNIVNYDNLNNNNKLIDNFNYYKSDFFHTSDYMNLNYNEKEIFNHKLKYERIIKEKIEYYKKNKNENLTTSLEKNYIFGPTKKKIYLKLTSLMIYFEDPSEQKEPYYNNYLNKNYQIDFPFSLLPLFYYKGINTFKKLLISIIKFENNYEKIKLDDKSIYNALLNLKDFSTKEIENEIKAIKSLKLPKKHKDSIKIEHEIDYDDNDLKFKNDKIDAKVKSYSIHPYIKHMKNNEKCNSYSFLWITPKKNYKVTIILPLITYTVPSNSIKIQQFIDFELLFYLYNINFLFWDFYVIKYLFGFKQFRFVLDRLKSHLPVFNMKIFLTEPKKNNYNLNEEKYNFIYTNENDITQIITLKCFNMNVSILDFKNHIINDYNIFFNFKQLIKILQIGKFASKIYFLIKFMDINNDNTLHFNYQELEQFDVINWLKDIEKYNGDYFLQQIKNPIEKLIREFNVSPTKKVKLEFFQPIIKIYKFFKINEKSNKYPLIKKIIDEFPNKNSFLEWSLLIKDSLDIIQNDDLMIAFNKSMIRKMSVMENTKELIENNNSNTHKKKEKLLIKMNKENEKSNIKRTLSSIDKKNNEKLFDMIKGKKGAEINDIDIPLPVISHLKSFQNPNI